MHCLTTKKKIHFLRGWVTFYSKNTRVCFKPDDFLDNNWTTLNYKNIKQNFGGVLLYFNGGVGTGGSNNNCLN